VSPPIARRGDVWYADVAGDKHRPVLIMSRDPMGEILNSVICAPITTRIRQLATEVRLGPEAGLKAESVANFDNTMLISRDRLIRRIGTAPPQAMESSCRALAIATGCP